MKGRARLTSHSHSQNGIEIQVDYSVIACLLMNRCTGGRPSKPRFEMISFYFTGLASEEELIARLEKLKATEEKRSLQKTSSNRHGESCSQNIASVNASQLAIDVL
ncbi:hypothetical protein Poly59_36540 [Rubripirellula reticaptiva]|uniref:Uncharacterized protein n=1 Tax=Rubripirellula reticaptiva TaxID=2528013 RepID=A0A5C6EN19_9BACT|nr:hypothetical protein Poly59_36540 [Rubripirellula reticaptiva]